MQLSELYIRGSLATQTMGNLTQTQIKEVDKIVKMIMADPVLAADKFEFIKQLGNTIRSDYKSDRDVAEQEFRIAVWRATVYLLHHRNYTYHCTLCGEVEYTTSTNKKKSFDRQYKVCPYCTRTFLNDQVASLKKESHGYYLVDGDGERISEFFRKRVDIEKILQSPIKPILGNRKVADPHKILDDKEQRGKWYSVWVWNYFRQILNENAIRTHNKHQVNISGPAHTVAVYELINEFKRLGHKYYVDESSINNSEVEILASIMALELDWSKFIISMIYKYKNYDVEITPTFFSVKIVAKGVSPIIESTIVTEDPVIMLSMNTPKNSSGNDESRNWSDTLESNANRDNISHDISVDEDDWMTVAYNNLQDYISKAIFRIYSQRGPIWDEFSKRYGAKEAAKSHIAKFLGVSIKKVEEHKRIIKNICNAMSPDNNDKTKYLVGCGDMVLIMPDNTAHIGSECGCIENFTSDGEWTVGAVITIKHGFIKVDGRQKLVKACECCFEHKR